MYSSTQFAKVLSLAIVLVCQPVASQISTVNGQAQYSGTPVLANPLGVPTMVYNCAKMPSICNNVHGNGGNYALTVMGNAGEKGRLANVPFLTLHVDTDTARVDTRRDQSCPTTGGQAVEWKWNHDCPEPDQPLVVPQPYNAGGRTISSGFVGHIANYATRDYSILDLSDAPTGMRWTCDEFPPAFSIEGGRQPNGQLANTYCAPWASADCTGGYTRSEQDFQSSAHGRIRTAEVAAGTLNFGGGIFEFHFMTEFLDEDDAFATRVDWYAEEAEHGVFYGQSELQQKRSRAIPRIKWSEHSYGNGSVAQFSHAIFEDGQPYSSDLSNNTSETLNVLLRDDVPTITHYLTEPTVKLLGRQDACSLEPVLSPEPTDGPGQFPGTPVGNTFATVSCFADEVKTIVGFS